MRRRLIIFHFLFLVPDALDFGSQLLALWEIDSIECALGGTVIRRRSATSLQVSEFLRKIADLKSLKVDNRFLVGLEPPEQLRARATTFGIHLAQVSNHNIEQLAVPSSLEIG